MKIAFIGTGIDGLGHVDASVLLRPRRSGPTAAGAE